MTIINQKSISGITSITFASAGDDLLTFHSNNGTERFRIDNSGNTKITAGIVTTLTVTGTTTLNGNLDLQDDDKILVGTGDDLEIYHDGTDTWVDNTQGDLYLRTSGSGDDIIIRSADDVLIQSQASEASVICRGDGQVEIYHNNDKKLETTSTGVTITGTATATEGLTLDGQTGSGKGLRLDLAGSGDYVIQETTTDDVVQFGGTGASNFFVHNISSGNISIATTTGTGNLNVAGTGDCALDLIADVDNNGSNQWPIINFRRNGATGTPAARIYHHETNGSLRFDNGGSERLRIQSGGGISFNGDSATANALDDYEEGTFTATCANSVTLHSDTDLLQYVKIGALVTVMGQIRVNSSNSGSSLTINNLPFTVFSSGEGSAYAVGAVRLYSADMASDHKYVVAIADGGSTNLTFQGVRDNNTSQGLGASDNGYYMFSVTYRTSS